jgi:hypothetical protein
MLGTPYVLVYEIFEVYGELTFVARRLNLAPGGRRTCQDTNLWQGRQASRCQSTHTYPHLPIPQPSLHALSTDKQIVAHNFARTLTDLGSLKTLWISYKWSVAWLSQ